MRPGCQDRMLAMKVVNWHTRVFIYLRHQYMYIYLLHPRKEAQTVLLLAQRQL